MKIKEVSCRQFAGLHNLSPITFADGINIVYGPNESGKSTLIDLMYSLLWQKSKVGNQTVYDKTFRSLYFPAETTSGISGTTIDGKLTLEDVSGKYSISKKWAANGNGELVTPSALLDEKNDAAAYSNCMKILTKYGEGVYREAIFANQKSIDNVLKALFSGNLDSNLDEAASSAILDMGGISSQKFLSSIEQKMKALDNSWDWITDGPSGGRGIDNKLTRNLGTIIEAYYTLEGNKKKLCELKTKTEALRNADSAHENAKAICNEALDARRTFDSYFDILKSYKSTAALKAVAESSLNRRLQAKNEWSTLTLNLKKAKDLREEMSRCETIILWNKISDILAKKEEIENQNKNLPIIDINDVNESKSLTDNIHEIETKLKDFNAQISFEMSEGYNLIVTSEIDGHIINVDGGTIELSETAKIEIPGVAVLHVSSADVDVEAITRDLEEKKASLADILTKYNVSSSKSLSDLYNDFDAKNKELERELNNCKDELNKALEGKEISEVKDAYESASKLPTREEEDLANEKRSLTADPIDTYIGITERKLDGFSKEFISEVENDAEIIKLQASINQYTEDLKSANQIPDEIKNVTDPDAHKAKLEKAFTDATNNKDSAYSSLSDARAAIKAEEEAEDFLQPDELSELVEENEATLLQLKHDYEDWKKIKEAAEAILNASSTNPLQSFEDNFREYLSFLSDGKISLPSLSQKLKADIHSGDNKMTYELLSEGTKDTVSLAFRLAVMNFLFPEGNGFIVLDDPFTDMDAIRTEKACELVKKFADAGNQVIFTTCDEKYKNLMKGNIINFM